MCTSGARERTRMAILPCGLWARAAVTSSTTRCASAMGPRRGPRAREDALVGSLITASG